VISKKRKIPFNKPCIVGGELSYMQQAVLENNHTAGNGPFTKKCELWLEKNLSCRKAILTHSCTAALEMSAILADIHPGDEIIMPSYTFVSTANAFVLRGGVPVFVDIRPDTLNINEALIEGAITERTKVILPVHYAGIPCDMNVIMKIAERNKLLVIEDAAQGILSTYQGRPLGSIGHLGACSFPVREAPCSLMTSVILNAPKLSVRRGPIEVNSYAVNWINIHGLTWDPLICPAILSQHFFMRKWRMRRIL
jgi:dTDP-4-amino-4,6-dideoxygalactose transaminase